MSKNKPEYDHWINKWTTDPSYRVMLYERLFWISISGLTGFVLGASI